MPLLIDGHNLVPKIPGLSLSQIDDEQRLLVLVQDYCRIRRKKAEVYFDKAPQGQTQPQRVGTLLVKFARTGRTADQEIKQRLLQLKGNAQNWTVVSSDRSVQAAARAARAQVLPAEDFARELLAVLRQQGGQADQAGKDKLSTDEVDYWLKLFSERKSDPKS